MSNERQHPDSTAETDEQVSTTYHELASERAPEQLNEKVLQKAAQRSVRPRYSRSIMWTRPLAWAATIALCLAITLEVTRVPTLETVPSQKPRSLAEAESRLPAATAPVERQDLYSDEMPLGRSTAKQVKDEPRREGRLRDAAFAATEEAKADAEDVYDAGVAAPSDFSALDTDIVQSAEKIARLQVNKSNQPVLNEATAVSADMSSVANECTDEVRTDPVTWLECIDDLEEAGDTDAAQRQIEDFKETFPQFELP